MSNLVVQLEALTGGGTDGVVRTTSIDEALKAADVEYLRDEVPVAITVASNEWKYVANLSTEFVARLPPVPVMPGPFNQVILNMIVNAAHAISDVNAEGCSTKGSIRIKTRRVEEWVEIEIQDTGCGMPVDIVARIFDPFFTTKAVGRGTGQGLPIAHNAIVDKHGGAITVDSRPGTDTTFMIRVPLKEDSRDSAEAA